ncbi:MAG TPA: GNAT family N-acetyltransferase [Sphingomicrobium sp.]|nr:GNAT family N-acetyltransferase [Sphingomicrobium sp.]
MIIPTLHTKRLILRAPNGADFPVYRRFYADAKASSSYGGPLRSGLAWRKLAYDVGHWALRGFGMWSLIERETGRMIGGCGIVWPDDWPRSELTWWITQEARRQGYALEASLAAIEWGYASSGLEQIETHMDDDNGPARALAQKLGGTIVAREKFPDGLVRNIYSLPLSSGRHGRTGTRGGIKTINDDHLIANA